MLSKEHQDLHQAAMHLCRERGRIDFQLIEILQKIEKSRLYVHLGVTSLFQYASQILGLSEATAYSFISVSKKSAQIPQLKLALKEQTLSVCKASRIVPALNRSNAVQLIKFAATHSKRDVEAEVARLNPQMARRETARPVSPDQFEVRVSLSRAEYEYLLRARELRAQRTSKNPELGETIGVALKEYVERHDPILRAKRSDDRRSKLKPTAGESWHEHPVSKPQLCPGTVEKTKSLQSRKIIKSRQPLSAQQEHAVQARDQGRCTYRDINGNRCTNERWLHIHHIKPVSQGGSNDPANLTTLCWVHHDLVHQLSLPIEGQVTWLKESVLPYRA